MYIYIYIYMYVHMCIAQSEPGVISGGGGGKAGGAAASDCAGPALPLFYLVLWSMYIHTARSKTDSHRFTPEPIARGRGGGGKSSPATRPTVRCRAPIYLPPPRHAENPADRQKTRTYVCMYVRTYVNIYIGR